MRRIILIPSPIPPASCLSRAFDAHATIRVGLAAFRGRVNFSGHEAGIRTQGVWQQIEKGRSRNGLSPFSVRYYGGNLSDRSAAEAKSVKMTGLPMHANLSGNFAEQEPAWSPGNVQYEDRSPRQDEKSGVFNAQAFLDSAGVSRTIVEYQKKDTIFSQGDVRKNVMYIQKGVNIVGSQLHRSSTRRNSTSLLSVVFTIRYKKLVNVVHVRKEYTLGCAEGFLFIFHQ
jgi:hypothetical protein